MTIPYFGEKKDCHPLQMWLKGLDVPTRTNASETGMQFDLE